MPLADLVLPTGESVSLAYLRKGPTYLGELTALQGLRSGHVSPDSLVALEYQNLARLYGLRLSQEVRERFDAIVTPPSTHSRVAPYLAALRRVADVDLSDGFRRHRETRSAEGCELGELIEAISYSPNKRESELKAVLIVDDIVASGRTAAALMHHMRLAGVAAECKFSLACPLWLPPSS
jgi:predicted amidophosphoribosyltransferase